MRADRPLRATIPPRGTADVTLTVNLSAKNAAQPLDVVHEFSMPIIMTAADSSTTLGEFRLTANVRSALVCSVASVYFADDDNVLPDYTFRSRSVHFTSAVPLRAVNVAAHPADLIVADARLESKTSGLITITPRVGLSCDRFECQASIHPIAADGSAIPATPLPVAAVVLHDIHASPPVVSFGPRAVGDVAEATVSLSSRTGRRFRVGESQPGATNPVVTIRSDPDGGAVMHVRQTIAEAGPHTVGIDVVAEPVDGSRVQLKLPVSYIGNIVSAKND